MSVALRAASPVAAPPRRSAPNRRTSLRAIIHRGLLDRRRAILIWGLSLGSLSAFMAAIYPSIRSSIDQIAKNYPSGLKEAFGVQAMNTVEGYIHAEMFSLIVPLAMGYFAIRAVAGPTVGAEERGYLDTILALPVSRTVLIAGNYLVAAVACAAIMAVTGAMTFIVGRLAGTDISLGLVAAGVMGVWPLAMLFGGVAALASGCLHNARTVTGLSVGILVAMYALDVAGRLASGLGAIRWLSAFRYYGAPMRDGIDAASFIGLTAVGLLLVIAGALLLERRDVLH
jgi:beta-exotoxin I transport system permease protein